MNKYAQRDTEDVLTTGSTTAMNRATKLFIGVEKMLSDLRGDKMTCEDIARLTGQSASTVFDWKTGANLRQIESLIRLLERLPRGRRIALIDQACRRFPTIYHHRIGWRERQTTICEALLRQDRGMTVIQGDEDARDFLATALGHSSFGNGHIYRSVRGIDIRSADRFVPVEGVIYLGATMGNARLGKLAREAWTSIRKGAIQFLLLNGVWLALPELHKEFKSLSQNMHVVIADDINCKVQEIVNEFQGTVHLLSVRQNADRSILINCERTIP